MNTVNKLVCIAGLAGLAATASAQTFIFNIDEELQSIPDGDVNGITYTGTVVAQGDINSAYKISTNSFSVLLDIEGDPIAGTGDLYSFLRSPTGEQAILLNRTGYSSDSAVGYQDNGFNIRLYDGTDANHKTSTGNVVDFGDVHYYQEDAVFGGIPDNEATGIFKTDGRAIDFLDSGDAFSAAARTLTLEVFQGINPLGEWSLFIADVSSGGSAKLNSWGLDFTPIPEPQEYAMAIGIGLLGFALYRRRLVKVA